MSLAPPFPTSYWADPFGDWPQWRKDAGLGPHRGLDMNGLPKGTPIPASGRGRVTWRTNLADPETTELGHRIVVFYPEANVYLGYSHLHESATRSPSGRRSAFSATRAPPRPALTFT